MRICESNMNKSARTEEILGDIFLSTHMKKAILKQERKKGYAR
jgi:hypothetical protein